MKPFSPFTFLSLGVLLFPQASQALVNKQGRSEDDFVHYATYAFPEVDDQIQVFILADHHDGSEPRHVLVNSSEIDPRAVAQRSFQKKRGSTSEDGFLLPHEDLTTTDVCDFLRGCYTNIAQADATTAAIAVANIGAQKCLSAAQTVWVFFTENNYAVAKQVAAYVGTNTIVPFAVNIASTAFTNVYMNGESGSEDPFTPTTANQQCDVADYEALAGTHASMVYDFCLYIANTGSLTNVPTHYTAGQFVGDESIIDGAVTLAKLNIAATKGKMQAECESLGVTWRRWIPSMAWASGL